MRRISFLTQSRRLRASWVRVPIGPDSANVHMAGQRHFQELRSPRRNRHFGSNGRIYKQQSSKSPIADIKRASLLSIPTQVHGVYRRRCAYIAEAAKPRHELDMCASSKPGDLSWPGDMLGTRHSPRLRTEFSGRVA